MWISNQLKLGEINSDLIYGILKETNANKAPSIDKLTGIFIKDGVDVLANPLSQIINISISSSTFPDPCKIAKLKALFKKGSKTDPKNYRPISLLPHLSKHLKR